LFETQKQYTPVEKLSGGEKKRLQLMQVLVKNPNFLILDEPTNDLDLETLQLLEDFLSDFQGCLLLVSHDRYFMDNLVDQLLLIEGGGDIRFFNGNYTDYRNSLEISNKEEGRSNKEEGRSNKEEGRSNKEDVRSNKEVDSGPSGQSNVKSKKLSFKEQKEFEELEKTIPLLEAKIVDLEHQMAELANDFNRISELAHELELLKATLEEKEMRWLELSE
jgi:ATP-binding cassette subfamily F protein uup